MRARRPAWWDKVETGGGLALLAWVVGFLVCLIGVGSDPPGWRDIFAGWLGLLPLVLLPVMISVAFKW